MLEVAYKDAQTASLQDGQICYVRRGEGPAIALLHGLPLSLLTWRYTIEPLAGGATVLAIDLKGFGRSQKQPGNYSPEGHAQVLLQLFDALGVQRVHIIGSSYGCAVGIVFALANPNRVQCTCRSSFRLPL